MWHRLLLSLLLLAGPAAAQLAVTDAVDARASACVWRLDAAAPVTLSLVAGRCEYGLASVSVGSHSLAVRIRDSAGSESPDTVLAFTRPAPPAVPANLQVVNDGTPPTEPPPTGPPMAIAFDNSARHNNDGVGGGISQSYTTSSGSNRVMVLFAWSDAYGGTPSTVTYNSVSLGSPVINILLGSVGYRVLAYVLAAPATGANTLAVSGVSAGLNVHVMTFTGVDQSTVYRTVTTDTEEGGGDTSCDATATNAQSGDYVVSGGHVNMTTITVGGGGESLANEIDNLFGSGNSYGTSYVAATGSTSMSWTGGGSGSNNVFSIGLIPLIPASSGVAIPVLRHHYAQQGMQ